MTSVAAHAGGGIPRVRCGPDHCTFPKGRVASRGHRRASAASPPRRQARSWGCTRLLPLPRRDCGTVHVARQQRHSAALTRRAYVELLGSHGRRSPHGTLRRGRACPSPWPCDGRRLQGTARRIAGRRKGHPSRRGAGLFRRGGRDPRREDRARDDAVRVAVLAGEGVVAGTNREVSSSRSTACSARSAFDGCDLAPTGSSCRVWARGRVRVHIRTRVVPPSRHLYRGSREPRARARPR